MISVWNEKANGSITYRLWTKDMPVGSNENRSSSVFCFSWSYLSKTTKDDAAEKFRILRKISLFMSKDKMKLQSVFGSRQSANLKTQHFVRRKQIAESRKQNMKFNTKVIHGNQSHEK